MIAGVGRRPADALLLQLLDQRRLGEARRRLREVLLGHELAQLQPTSPSVSGGSWPSASSSSPAVRVVAPLGVDADEAVELQRPGRWRGSGASPAAMSTVVWS